MTPRQREVAALIARGLTNREIARDLRLAERTAEDHVRQLMNVVGAETRTQVATWWLRRAAGEPPAAAPAAPALLMCELLVEAGRTGAPGAVEAGRTGAPGAAEAGFEHLFRDEARRHGARLEPPRAARGGRLAAIFPSASGAAAAALGVRTAAGRAATGPGAARLRAALHAGRSPGSATDPGAAKICARLLAGAAPGQILVSGDLARELASVLPPGCELRERATLDPLGRPQRSRVFELTEAGRTGNAAPPPLDRARTNLPLPLTSFVGRERELADLAALHREHRLLTLSGMGGCGKTRLALRFALERQDAYPDGVWLVELGAVADPAVLAPAAAAALGVREQPGRDLTATLLEHLADRRLLLLLDNAEHLVQAVAGLAASLLAACPGLKVLVTSREPLGLPGEMTYRVPALPFPAQEERLTSAEAAAYDAVRLFVDRAREQDPRFQLDGPAAAAAGQVCALLDGIPLAIELAAGWVGLMTVDEILERLEDRFGLLVRGRRTAPARQQTLAGAVDWSFRQLGEPERELLARISVFAGEFEVADVEAVCEGGEGLARLLESLFAKSLVVADGGRFRCLETIREYGRRRLEERGEAEPVARRHALHFSRVLAGLQAEMPEPRRLGVDRRLPNLRSALAWSLAHEPALALEIAGGMWDQWHLRGGVTEARAAAEALVGVVRQPAAARAQALTFAAAAAYAQNDLAAGVAHAELALPLARQAPESVLAAALRIRGYLAMAADDYETAVACVEEELAASRAGGLGTPEVAQALHDVGVMAGLRGRLEEARGFFERSLEVRTALGRRDEGHVTLAFMAMLCLLAGDAPGAGAPLRESLAAAARLGDRRAAWGLDVAACLAAASGRPGRALTLAGAAAAMFEQSNTVPATAWPRLTASWLGPARASLPAGQGTAAEEAGRRLDFAGALAYALAT